MQVFGLSDETGELRFENREVHFAAFGVVAVGHRSQGISGGKREGGAGHSARNSCGRFAGLSGHAARHARQQAAQAGLDHLGNRANAQGGREILQAGAVQGHAMPLTNIMDQLHLNGNNGQRPRRLRQQFQRGCQDGITDQQRLQVTLDRGGWRRDRGKAGHAEGRFQLVEHRLFCRHHGTIRFTEAPRDFISEVAGFRRNQTRSGLGYAGFLRNNSLVKSCHPGTVQLELVKDAPDGCVFGFILLAVGKSHDQGDGKNRFLMIESWFWSPYLSTVERF